MSVGAARARASAVLSHAHKMRLDAMLRVDHAGEVGANAIYRGQAAVLRARRSMETPSSSSRDETTKDGDALALSTVMHMWEQEKTHLRVLDAVLGSCRVRPSALRPLWDAAGFALGAGSALLGREAAMACTEAVESVIGQHYNDQIRDLLQLPQHPEITKLIEVLRQFRDDELKHLNTAVEQDAKKAPAYTLLNSVIQTGCRAAIWIASRV